jgi:hypothetical protein
LYTPSEALDWARSRLSDRPSDLPLIEDGTD